MAAVPLCCGCPHELRKLRKSDARYATGRRVCQHKIRLICSVYAFIPNVVDVPPQTGIADSMNDKPPPRQMSDKHNKFHAEKRRARRDAAKGPARRSRPNVARENTADLLFYGLHTVKSAILNPSRTCHTLYATQNALNRLELAPEQLAELPFEEKTPRELDRMVGSDAVHQGAVLQVSALAAKPLDALSDTALVLVLDQVTDPHNVGAILRSAVAMDAGAVITTSRYSPVESGVLAKSASGALDLIAHIEVRNLAEALETLAASGFTTVGLDSEGEGTIEALPPQSKIALVLGSEGKGLRHKTRETCAHLVRLDMPGRIKSLNVSNAAALALYVARSNLRG